MPERFAGYYKSIRSAGKAIFLLFFFLQMALLTAQETQPADTTINPEAYKQDSAYQSPRKAAILSAVLPGLGQVYNHKYWKVPIVYAGFGTFAYFIHFNQKGYLRWKQAYIDFPDYDLDYDFPLTIEQIDRTKNAYKRYRDLSIIGTAGFYLLQILDATVDAYLFDWDITEDLSLKLEPDFLHVSPGPVLAPAPAMGLTASFRF